MIPQIRSYRALDGYPLHYRHWRPEASEPLARIVALHGIQSHSDWYGWSSGRLCETGYEICFLDRRGSGMNERDRGHAASREIWINDVVQFLSERHLEDRLSARQGPTVLMGISWGGKLATAVAARRPDLVDGLALLYPGLCARVRPTWWQHVQLTLADMLGIREKRVPIPLQDPALFTGQPVWQEYIRNDPLALHEVSVAFLLENRELDRSLPSLPPQIKMPVLLMLAGRDRIIDNVATRSFVERFLSRQKTIQEYAEACHTLEFEPDRARIGDDLLTWLQGVVPLHRSASE